MSRHPIFQPVTAQRGVVLPIALIMLVIISFAGLLAARNSASFEQFSNNLRTNQVARTSAEDALRHCERIAIDSVDGGAAFPAEVLKIVTAEISADDVSSIQGGEWNIKANWAPDTSANLITFAKTYGGDVQLSDAQKANNPTCIVQSLVNDRFLITSRGLSADAMVDGATGELSAGSEVWLQSILTPSVPTLGPQGGIP
jgi:type IV pilus assembly protein PilX